MCRQIRPMLACVRLGSLHAREMAKHDPSPIAMYLAMPARDAIFMSIVRTPSVCQYSASTHQVSSLPASLAATTSLHPRPHTHTLRHQTDEAHCPTLNRKHCGPSVCCRTVCYPPYRLPGRQPANRQTISTISREPQRHRPILPRVSRLYGCKGH
jgi:hypothetical protein